MNAIKFLEKEHDHVRRVFADISEASHQPATKCKMLEQLCQELLVHENMEETIWYPYLEESNELEVTDIIKHLIGEEKKAEKLLKELWKSSAQKEWEEKKFNTFQKEVEHHATEEETKLFPKVENKVAEEELKEIGKRMVEFKKELMEKMAKQKKQMENERV